MQRPLVVNVNEAPAGVAVPLLETQVAYRATQTVMIDAAGAGLGITLVAIHRHSLDIPLLVAVPLAQLADRCWLIGWGQERKGWTGKRRQSALGLVTLVLGEEVSKSLIQCEILNTEVCAACLDQPIKPCGWGARCEELLGIRKPPLSTNSVAKAVGPVADSVPGSAIEAQHFVVEVGFGCQFRRSVGSPSARHRVTASYPRGSQSSYEDSIKRVARPLSRSREAPRYQLAGEAGTTRCWVRSIRAARSSQLSTSLCATRPCAS